VGGVTGFFRSVSAGRKAEAAAKKAEAAADALNRSASADERANELSKQLNAPSPPPWMIEKTVKGWTLINKTGHVVPWVMVQSTRVTPNVKSWAIEPRNTSMSTFSSNGTLAMPASRRARPLKRGRPEGASTEAPAPMMRTRRRAAWDQTLPGAGPVIHIPELSRASDRASAA